MKKFIFAAIAVIMFFSFSNENMSAKPLVQGNPDGSVTYIPLGDFNNNGQTKNGWCDAKKGNGEKICSNCNEQVCIKWSWNTPAKDIIGFEYTDPTDPMQCLADLQSEISIHMPELLNPWYGFIEAQEDADTTLSTPTETPTINFIVYPILP